MKNIEKYYDVLTEQMNFVCYINNKILKKNTCGKVPCSECNKEGLKWLNQEYKEPIKLTEDEKVILRNLPKKYKWIARDSYGRLWIHKNKPCKRPLLWEVVEYEDCVLEIYNHLFRFINWGDDEPYSIEELLKEG